MLVEFAQRPDIVIIRAAPDSRMDWMFNKLKEDGFINHIIERAELPYERSCGTTYSESHNINIGLNYVLENYKGEAYVIVQAADIQPQVGVYKFLEKIFFLQRVNAIAFWWDNSVNRNSFHTNFFAIKPQATEAWPPVSEYNNPDVLEVQWGNLLTQTGGVERISNWNKKFFLEVHQSESLISSVALYLQLYSGLSLSVTGCKPQSWWNKLKGLWNKYVKFSSNNKSAC